MVSSFRFVKTGLVNANPDFVFTGLWFSRLAWLLVVKSFKTLYYSQFQAFKVLIKNNKHIFFKSDKRFFRENGP